MNFKHLPLAATIIAFLLISGARAQDFGFTPSAPSQSISASTTSSSITLSATPQTTVLIANTGSVMAYITNTATATTAGSPLPAGSSIFYNFQPSTTVSAITAGGSTTLLVSKGSGQSAIGNTLGGVTVSVDGNLAVNTPPASQLFDAFSSTLDTVTNWTTNNSTGTAATSAGALAIASSTTASARGGLTSKQSWAPQGISSQVFGVWATFATKTIANSARVFGIFTVPGSPSITVPATDGDLWRLDGAGSLFAEIWATGVAVSSTDVTAACPITNSVPNTYAISYRTGLTQFYCGSTLAVTVLGTAPAVQTLPVSAFSIAGPTPPLSSATMTLGGLALVTYAPAGGSKAAGQAPTINDPSQVVTVSPNAYGLTPATTAALASNQIVKAAPGNLYSFEVGADSTLSAAAWWIMLFDSTTLPGDGAVTPKKCYPMPSGTTGASFAFGAAPVAFTTGIVIGVSTTGCFSKTASVHAFISGDAQ